MTVKLAAQFTKETRDRNGLIPIADAIAKNRHDWSAYAVVRLECVRVTDEGRDGWVESPTVGVVHIEPLDGDEAAEAAKLLTAAFEARTGKVPLPFDDPNGDVDLLDGEDGAVTPAKDEWLESKA